MDIYPIVENWTGTPGAIAPADGNVGNAGSQAFRPENLTSAVDTSVVGAQHAAPLLGNTDLGPNNERLEDAKPKLVHALRELVRQYREEGEVARRHEIQGLLHSQLLSHDLS